jgi:hypothetical protein
MPLTWTQERPYDGRTDLRQTKVKLCFREASLCLLVICRSCCCANLINLLLLDRDHNFAQLCAPDSFCARQGHLLLRLFHYCLRLVDGDPVVGRINNEQDLRMMRRREVRKRISGGNRSLPRRQLGLILFHHSAIIRTGDKALVTGALDEEFPTLGV